MRVADYFDRTASINPQQEAFVDIDLDRRLSYQDARNFAHQVAVVLTEKLGLAAGSKVAVYSPNDSLAFLAIVGVSRADMVWLPLNFRNALATNAQLLSFFGADVLIFHSQFEDSIAEIKSLAPDIKHFLCLDGDSSQGDSLRSLFSDGPVSYDSGPEDPMATTWMLATGGTTGPSKGVEHSHHSVEATINLQILGAVISPNPRYLVIAPMTHAAGYMIPAFVARNGTVVVLPEFEAGRVLETIEAEKITHLFLPPAALYGMLDHPDAAKYDYSSLQAFYIGAAPTAPERYKEAVARFGPCITEIYGQTETMFPLLYKSTAECLDDKGAFRESVLRSAGRVCPGCRVEIMSEDGQLLGPNEPGEIVVRGSSVMKGYYTNPEATAEVSRHGWHHTTDVGVKDEEGYITIVDRIKDMIISGGFNIYPVEIENVINGMAEVQNCAVIGVPDSKWGEAIKAVIVLQEGSSLEAESVMALCKEKLGSMKAPKSVEFWDALPLSPVGKILKREIRDRFTGQTS
ncbi:class I adenylate-forming enzyme family protein [Congregibacter litoralis]|uniref:Acyl-CoA synthetase (AMP-forming)/AMP-acid ligase II n=1 Tax=Congregibacter litoralis KT71 TaxID=314285 RepID=A4ABA8_9GAMM|nr:AMP-binding protein [Congregibacter litoralis]EAQ96662.1 Acyl-CoA synthetase (AMP-forming)/AMP-acid ligase II [Congregibacter litoralis KT71]